ncbi:hypothetical protein [Bacillus pseudomycoides]|uniref:hypothetical protein n=1 Tax=Bacillus pseudomycoides TaxID=64104 RepID=UPI0023D9CE52|nr:hypothetical protein [Bacillus pseudomycoides]MDF2086415.1 hypothetical protein [Bacillus pseudomycoides]
MDERKMRLKRKVKIAKQKSQRYKLMRLLTEDMSTVIEKSDVITSPELEIILNKVYEKWKFELHKWDFVINYSNFRKEFSWEQEVIQYVQRIDIEEKLVYLFLGIDDSPIFLVNGKWAIENFSILWQCINNDDIWIISQDFSYGVLVFRYGGYLEHDPNPKEIFYAITKWDN